MSLITLTSTTNAQNPSQTDPAIIKNHFKDGIKIRKGDEIGLVSLSFNKITSYEVIAGENDTLTWRIGDRQNFLNHVVTLDPGVYSGQQLATQIQSKLNASTILGNYDWKVIFDSSKFNSHGSFTIDYEQLDVPVGSTNTLSHYSGGELHAPHNGTASIEFRVAPQVQHAGNDDFMMNENPVLITGSNPIFPNDGGTELIIKPVIGYPLASFNGALGVNPVVATKLVENDGGVTRTFELASASAPQQALGWDYKATYDDGGADEFWHWRGNTGGTADAEGSFGIGTDGTIDGTNAGNWDVAEIFYNKLDDTLRDVTAGGRANIDGQTGTGLVYYKYNGADPSVKVPLNVAPAGVGYGSNMVGYVRNFLFEGRDNYPGNGEALIKAQQSNGFDITARVRDNPAKDGIIVSMGQLVQNAGIIFPNGGWDGNSALRFDNYTPDSWSGQGTGAVDWGSFDYGNDHIKVKINISKVRTFQLFISHDNNGDGVFVEDTRLVQTGQANITRNLKEALYPLRSCYACSQGGHYNPQFFISSGTYSPALSSSQATYTISKSEDITRVTGEGATFGDDLADNNADVGTTAPTNAMTLSSLFIFGTIFSEDIGGGDDQIPQADVPGNRTQNNIDLLIGFDTFETFDAGNTSNPITSISQPLDALKEPTILVELVDFNIEGYNGATSDTSKLIAVIPAEELNTNTRSGTLNYYSHYPIMINLNTPYDRNVYDLNVILRTPDGRVVDDLIPSTNLTLLLKESEDQKQKRMIQEISSNLQSSRANMQDIKIDQIGINNPKL
jgi:hypothetical protein